MKSIIFPFSISSETIEKGGGVNIIPMNGRMFSCRSHFHPTTSLARSLGYSVKTHLKVPGINQLTLSTLSGSAVVVTFRVFIATGDPPNVALYTSAVPPVANGVSSCSTSVGSSTNEGRIIPKVPHNFRRYFRYWVCFSLGRSAPSRAWMYGQNST